jgi:hypothetical protein
MATSDSRISACQAPDREAVRRADSQARAGGAPRQSHSPYRELYLDYTRRTQALFGQAAAESKADIDHRSAATGLIALIDGLGLELAIDDKAVSVGKAVDLCLHHIDQQLGLRGAATKGRRGGKRA